MPVCVLGRNRKEVRWQGELWGPAVGKSWTELRLVGKEVTPNSGAAAGRLGWLPD